MYVDDICNQKISAKENNLLRSREKKSNVEIMGIFVFTLRSWSDYYIRILRRSQEKCVVIFKKQFISKSWENPVRSRSQENVMLRDPNKTRPKNNTYSLSVVLYNKIFFLIINYICLIFKCFLMNKNIRVVRVLSPFIRFFMCVCVCVESQEASWA